ncbi:hypothetical protein VNO80_11541 [Phaseolus coccineus]|uniref:Uncharacterized protein n=1 Tax=Phaseolus coccineus TaxID=3886 RepID=A0AAN9NFD6_PHACN
MRMVCKHTIGKGIHGQVLDSPLPLPFCYLSSHDTFKVSYEEHGFLAVVWFAKHILFFYFLLSVVIFAE